MLRIALITSTVWWILHIHIFSYLSKKISNKWTLATRRWLFLMVTMLPILLFADFSKINFFINYWYYVLILWIVWAISLYCNFHAQAELPSGVFSVLSRGRIPLVMILSFILLGDILSIHEYIGIFLIVISSILMVISIESKKINISYSSKWLLFMWARVFTDAAWVIGMWFFVKYGDRALSAYILECNIALCLIIITVSQRSLKLVSKETFWYLLWAGLCVLAWTGGMAFATKLSSASLVTWFLSIIPVGNALLWRFYYHEYLKYRQWIWIWLTVLGVIIMKI